MGAENIENNNLFEVQLRELIKNKKLPNVTNYFENRRNWTRFKKHDPLEKKTLLQIYDGLYKYSIDQPSELSPDETRKIKPNLDNFKETLVETKSFDNIDEMINFCDTGWQLQQTKLGKMYQNDFENFLKEEKIEKKQFIVLRPFQNLILHISDKVQKDPTLRNNLKNISEKIGQLFRVNNLQQLGFVDKAYARKDIELEIQKFFINSHKISLGSKFFPQQISLQKHTNLDDQYEIIMPIGFDWHLCLGDTIAKNFLEPSDQEALFINFLDIFRNKLSPKKT